MTSEDVLLMMEEGASLMLDRQEEDGVEKRAVDEEEGGGEAMEDEKEDGQRRSSFSRSKLMLADAILRTTRARKANELRVVSWCCGRLEKRMQRKILTFAWLEARPVRLQLRRACKIWAPHFTPRV